LLRAFSVAGGENKTEGEWILGRMMNRSCVAIEPSLQLYLHSQIIYHYVFSLWKLFSLQAKGGEKMIVDKMIIPDVHPNYFVLIILSK